ncbi:hypothetical protein BCR36DRAFT_587853 [Piromyces finnis]|uniref:Uncharacterized protein n=1 Tax=Piromyces finnis TaxID=1754191 RepID=A0A1Y1UVY9_9FUNG|nr:hypothetical protein BCR36DRAFT_587853 [Piromyces finnis]|eukprot:ORX41642.1 hypothetical protein BCR36DRAFT_587853 [Piromyces finnis]
MYYASSVPLTVTTTANANMNNSDVSSLISSYFCDNDEQYVVDDSNTITYIVNSNHDEKSISMTPPSNNESFINTITASNSPSSINNICYNQPNKMNNNNGIRSSNNNTQIKSLLPMKYYNNNSINRIYMLNSSPMNTSSTIPTNTTSMKDSNNNTQTIVIKNEDETISMNHLQQQITTTTASSSPRLNSIINSPHTTTTTTTTTTIATTTSETSYTNLEQEKIRGPMMYSTTGNNTNVMNLSPRITNIITSQTSASNQHKNITNMGTSSPVSSSSSSTISIISVASGQSNVALKDSILTCSSDSSQISDTNGDTVSKKDKSSKTSTKQSKNKSTTNLCGKSGIVGFAAEILTSVLPTSNNNLKHPKTRYLPELYPFIKKITHKCKIDIRTFLYALVYSQRFAEALLSFHKEAVGEYGTNHRIFLGSLLLAYQYQINHGMKVDFKLDAKKLSKLTDGVWTEKEVEMMCKALLSTKNFTVEINDDVVKQFVETHKADLCWYS